MEKLTVVVCGDSWMTRDCEYPGTHFSELLDERFEVVNLARAGVSHVEIAFQLKHALTLDPKFVLIGATYADRIELPITDAKHRGELTLEHFRPGHNRRYISTTLASNIDTGRGLFGDLAPYMSQERIQAINQYLLHIHDFELKNQTDQWILGYWLSQFEKKSVPWHVFDHDFVIYGDWRINSPIYHAPFEIQKQAAKWVDNFLATALDN